VGTGRSDLTGWSASRRGWWRSSVEAAAGGWLAVAADRWAVVATRRWAVAAGRWVAAVVACRWAAAACR
jgi:hypothetical protein